MAAFARIARRSRCRGVSRKKQAGFISVGLRGLLLFAKPRPFTVYDLFRANEPGFHFETYDPNSLLQRRNRLTYSSQFSNAAWTRTNILSVTDNADGVGDLVVPNTTAAAHSIAQSALSIGVRNTVTVRAKAGGYSFIAMSGGWAGSVWFDIGTGAVGSNASGVSATITAAADAPGYYDCTVSDVSAISTWSVFVCQANGASSFAGNGVSGVYLARAQLEWNTSTASSYQEVTDWNTEYMAAALERIGMWQEAIGGTPVTGVEQPLGCWYDSKRGITRTDVWTPTAAINATAVSYNGNGSTVVNGDGSITCTCTVAGNYGFWVTTLPGSVLASDYLARFTILANSAARSVNMDHTLRTMNLSSLVSGGIGSSRVHYTPSGAGSTTAIVYIIGGLVGESFTFRMDSLSVVLGNHATQSSSSSRPILSARFNQCVKTEQFSDAAWTKTLGGTGVAPTVTDNFGVAPDGTTTAARVQYNRGAGTTAADFSYLGNAITATTGALYGSKMWVKSNTASTYTLEILGVAGTAVLVSVGPTWTLIDSGNQVSPSAAPSGVRLIMRGSSSGADQTADVLVWHPDVRSTNDWALNQPAYQRVNTSTDYDTTGFIHYLRFDGTDDSLQTPSIDFTGVDKMTVWMGATKLSDVATAIIAELSAGATTNNGSFYVVGPPSAAATQYQIALKGTAAAVAATANGYAAPVTSLLTSLFDLSASAAIPQTLRVNGAQAAASATSVGNGPFGNHALNIGRRNNTSLPLNGRLTSLTGRGSTTPTSEKFIGEMNRYAARLAGQTNVTT